MKYTEMAQREIYNLVSSYVGQLQDGRIQLNEFDDVELTEWQSERLIEALSKEANKLATALEKRGVVVF
jgi:sporulation protein YlmC with PRC-barrel domain